MKKIVAILWHNSANRMRVLREEIDQIADVRIFSAGSLGDGEEDITELYAAIDQAELLLLNETASDPVWKEINEYIKNSPLPMVYVGGEAATHVKTPQQAKWTAFANAYYTYGGAENTLNMLRFLCAEVLGEAMPYEEVKRIPWNAIFAPDGNTLYDSPESYFVDYPRSTKGTIALVISRSAWVSDDMQVENCLIREIRNAGFSVLPIFTYAMADKNLGAFGVEAALEKFCFLSDGTPCVDGMIRLAGMFNHGASSAVMQKLRCPVIKPICSYSMTVDEWRENPDGTIADVAWSIALPELDGVIEPMFIGAQERHGEAEHRVPVESRYQVAKVLEFQLQHQSFQ